MSKNFAKREAKDYTFFTTFFQRFCVSFFFWPFYTIMYNMKVYGRENIPRDRSILLAANHTSLLDPPAVAAAVSTGGKTVAYMAKRELFDIPILRTLIWWLGAFAVNREKLQASTIKTAKAALASKHWTMALFPQGGRRRNDKLNKVNKGFITLAKLTQTDILPVGIILKDYKIAKKPFEGNMIIKMGTVISHEKEVDEIMAEWKKQVCEMTGLIDNSSEFENEQNTESVKG